MRISRQAILTVCALLATRAFAQSATETRGAAPFVENVENTSAPTLVVDAPLAGPLAQGAVIIPFHVDGFRIVPLIVADTVRFQPRTGHLHITLDDLTWHWSDFSGVNTIVLGGLSPGPHKVLIELAAPNQHVLTARTVTFTVPNVRH